MPRDDEHTERKMTRLVVAALAMSGMCSGTEGRGIAGDRLALLADCAAVAADQLIARLAQDEPGNDIEIYQRRRKRFEGVFFGELAPGTARGAALTFETVQAAWKRACKQVEPEFFGDLKQPTNPQRSTE